MVVVAFVSVIAAVSDNDVDGKDAADVGDKTTRAITTKRDDYFAEIPLDLFSK